MAGHKSDKYAVENQKWFDYCTDKSCDEKTIRCEVCGHNGHKTEWLDTTKVFTDETNYPDEGICFGVNIFIAHAHFVANRDTGRHVTHKIDERSVPKKYCHLSYTLKKRKLPDHVRKIIDGENY